MLQPSQLRQVAATCRDVEPVRIRRVTREDPEGAHPAQGKQRQRGKWRNWRLFRVEQHLVPRGELHVPPVSIKLRLRLAQLLLLLQQRKHLRRSAAHEDRRRLHDLRCHHICRYRSLRRRVSYWRAIMISAHRLRISNRRARFLVTTDQTLLYFRGSLFCASSA